MNIRLNPEIAAAFAEEAHSFLGQAAEGVAQWAAGDLDAAERSRRLVHTVKGAASMIGLASLANTALMLEDALKAAASSPAVPADPRTAPLRAAAEALGAYSLGIASGDRRNGDLAAAIVSLRRAQGKNPAADGAVVQEILAKDGPAPMWTQPPAAAPETDAPLVLAPSLVSGDVLANYRQEAEDLLLVTGRALRQLQREPENVETLKSLRRSIHTLKGLAQSAAQAPVAELCHRLEDLLDGLLERSAGVAPAINRLIFGAFDLIADVVNGEIPDAVAWERIQELRAEIAGETGRPVSESAAAGPEPEPDDVVAPEFLEIFRPEAEEHLAAIASGLRELEADLSNKTALRDVRRAVHTLKGAAGVIGLMKANTLAHRMEDLLDAAWEGSIGLSADHLQLLFATADVLADLSGDVARHPNALARRNELMAVYSGLTGQPKTIAASVERTEPPKRELTEGQSIDLSGVQAESAAAPSLNAAVQHSRYVRVPLERLDEMVRLMSELVVSRSAFEQYLDAYRHDIEEMRLTLSRLQRLSHKFDTDIEVQAFMTSQLPGRPGLVTPIDDKRAEFDALEFDRYTGLHLAARDLGEITSDIGVGVNQLSNVAGDFDSYVNRMGRLTSDAQDRLMRMRMVPLVTLATRLHRTVRVTSDRLGKQVELILEGEEIELDKTALEELAGPLEHLLRNAIGHGVETEGMRRAAGKTARGHVTVRAYYSGTQVVIEVADDGAGISLDGIRRKALSLGVATEEELAGMSDTALYNFLFVSGFSTAGEITEISGRGVGLDVVRTAVEKLKGVVNVDSRPGHGTTFQLRLPMSLAILRVLMVKAQGEVYAVPLANVSRILRLEAGQLEKLGNHQVLRLGQNVMPALRLDEALGKSNAEAEAPRLQQPVIVVDAGGQQAAILVDQLLLAREVVVKSLGAMFRRVRGITGATILGDGGIVLIVNTPELLGGAQTEPGHAAGRIASMRRSRQARAGYDVLVVDDSVSVRRVLCNLFENQGWRPVAARDGMEALELLQSGRSFDAVLLDMEMPRMDGFELLALLRGQPAFANLPVVMLTSRAAEKHRRKAFELGATEFLIKPYQDDALLSVIGRVVRGAEAMAG